MFSVTKDDLDEAVREGRPPEEVRQLESLLTRKDCLVAKIENAFVGVRLGKGIGLFEADAWDMCTDSEERERERMRDERESWQKISESDLEWGGFSQKLCFTDAEGFRFLIPAFMVAELNSHALNDETLCHLSNMREDENLKCSLLDSSQLETIVDYLRLRLDDPWCEFFHEVTAEA
ncbi:MAG: DUF6714 family protein, partial [Verrucomicrobiales bacterium]